MCNLKRSKKEYAEYQVMGNSTKQKVFGDIKVIQEGELRLSLFRQATMSIEEAYKLYSKGLAISVA